MAVRSPIRIWTSLAVAAIAGISASAQEADQKITFEDHVKPIFQQRCAACHNGDKQSGGLNLSNFTSLMQGGSSGAAIEAGDAGGSWLYNLITHEESPEMPPGGTKIPDEEIARIEAWINAGAMENSGSVAKKKTGGLAASSENIGARPESVALPPRLSLEPHFHSAATGIVNAIAVHPWAPIAALAAPKQILIYRTDTLELVGSMPFPEGQANALRFSRNGQMLMAGGGRHGLAGKVVVWDVGSAERALEVGDELDNVLAADISADHALVALGGPQKMLRVFSTADGAMVYESKKHTDWITAIEFSPDGVLLASADRNGGLQIWEAATGNEYLTLGGHEKAITDISWRADGNVLATAGDDGAIRWWEMENGGQIKSWNAHATSVTAIQFTRSGQLVSAGRDLLAKVWQPDGQHLRDLPGLQEIGVSIGYCEETGSVIASSLAGNVFVWKVDDGTVRGNLDANPPPLAVRLQNASESLRLVANNLQPLDSQLVTAEDSLATLNAERATQQTALDQFTLQLSEMQTQIESINEQTSAAKTQRDSWLLEFEETRQAIPLVAESHKNALAASNLLPQDQKLKDTANSLEEQQQQLTARSTELETSIENSAKSVDEQLSRIPGLQSNIAEAESKVSQASSEIARLTEQVEPVQQQKTELLEKISAARLEVDSFQQQVDRWQREMDFHLAVEAKLNQLANARQQIDEKQAALQAAQDELQKSQAEYNLRLSDTQNSEQAASAVELELKELRKPK